MSLSPATLQVLDAIMRLRMARKIVTVRAIGRAINQTATTTWISIRLRRLREEGLIDWEAGSNGTIRPLVRFIPADMLEES